MGTLFSGLQRQAVRAALVALYPARLLVDELAGHDMTEPSPSSLLHVGPDD